MFLSIQTTSLGALTHRHVTTSVSTNSELIEAIQSGTLSANDRQLLTAETQTAGRGQHTRSWQSPIGNVYLSLYHPIGIPISGLLSLIIGANLAKMPVIQALNLQLTAQTKTPIGVKWANDLGFYPLQKQDLNFGFNKHNLIAFNKLAGILIEPVWIASQLKGIVIGVGLNVAATPKLTEQTLEGMSYQAISLQDIYESIKKDEKDNPLEPLPSLAVMYEQISQALLDAVECFKNIAAEKSNLQPSSTQYAMAQFNQQFKEQDALKSLKVRITQNLNNEEYILEGQTYGIDTNGCLQLQQDNGNISAIFTGRIDVINET
ncbi:biotin--[acetyl-CoA-carboxylase] ligase [Psychrobacter sp. 1U2]|uniref:biotin--[acetyl-CoA-carboxylase] ligase n=1 Tax=Psychrobacter sp. 1U2 TaxID=3453577 RepID=UPI003F4832B8